jgi:hypothetical protein
MSKKSALLQAAVQEAAQRMLHLSPPEEILEKVADEAADAAEMLNVGREEAYQVLRTEYASYKEDVCHRTVELALSEIAAANAKAVALVTVYNRSLDEWRATIQLPDVSKLPGFTEVDDETKQELVRYVSTLKEKAGDFLKDVEQELTLHLREALVFCFEYRLVSKLTAERLAQTYMPER